MVGVTDMPALANVRARSFGAAAADYDRYRPRYPDQLVDDVVAVVPGRRVVEVGAGTGIATAAFACGVQLLGRDRDLALHVQRRSRCLIYLNAFESP